MLAQPPSQFHDSTTYSKQHRRSIRPLRHRKPNAQLNPSVVKTRLTSVLTIVAVLVGFALAGAERAHAANITVSNTNDSGSGSLRQALADANDGDTIDFDLTYPATITLTSGQLVVDKSITISGPGADLLTVKRDSAAPNFRIFIVNSGKTVTISGLTISSGSATGSPLPVKAQALTIPAPSR
jgi:hypothetical protein